MNLQVRKYLWSFAISVILTALIVALSSLPSSPVGILLWPGMAAAAVAFPQGIHSDSANTYLVLAGIFNVFFSSWLVLGVWVLIGRFRKRDHISD